MYCMYFIIFILNFYIVNWHKGYVINNLYQILLNKAISFYILCTFRITVIIIVVE